jgi:cephalosporin hydroxylase
MNPEYILSKRKKLPSDIYGLRWIPSLEPEISNDEDWLGKPWEELPRHFTELDSKAVTNAFLSVKDPKLIIEIGVDNCECFEWSSTYTLLTLKPLDCIYIGIDTMPKYDLNDFNKNIYTLQCDSANYIAVYDKIRRLGNHKIDFMFVDGWHSINQVLKEWKYWEGMSDKAVMAFHDTNCHPGPVSILDAIDPDLFSVEYFGRGEHDWGVGVVKRKTLSSSG